MKVSRAHLKQARVRAAVRMYFDQMNS